MDNCRSFNRIDRFSVVVLILLYFSVSGAAQTSCAGDQIFRAPSCNGDLISADERTLFDLVNKYRVANGRREIKPSTSLNMVANRRMLDLRQNVKFLTHSWSDCKYDTKVEKTWTCVTESPQRLNSGYKGQGYETLYRTSVGRVLPVSALDAWKKSTLHNSIILNLGTFKDMEWEELGVAIDGEYAALWFGSKGAPQKISSFNSQGLGVSFDQAVKGLSKLLSIEQSSSAINTNRWQGYSTDRKIKLEIYGQKKEISEANLDITIKLDANQALDAKSKQAVSTLLGNIFPDWQDRESWFDASLAAIIKDRSASRTKVLRKIIVLVAAEGRDALKVSISPETRPKYVEIF